ncbi:MAG: autotransporter domain-containing protein [Reyranella sp.]|nr:MAG: autotransporter domain-containing protein [Reyranella sp.]
MVRRWGACCLAIAILGIAPSGVLGQNATWLASPATGDFGSAGNWSPAAVPTGTASFGASNTTTIQVGGGQTLGAFQFNAGGSAYTFEVTSGLEFTGAGITNNSGQTQTLAVTTASGSLMFSNSSTAGNATISVAAASQITFDDTSTAGTATISNAGTMCFCNDATAGSASITNAGTGTINFFSQTTAGSSTITNNGGTINFTADSAGGTARYVGNSGTLDISGLSGTGMSIGSIEGAGTILLGSKRLTVGSTNLSTSVGAIADGGTSGGTGGSLVKVGTGTLTLSGNNSYTGGTVIGAGTIAASSDSNLGGATGSLTFGENLLGNPGGTLRFLASFNSTRATTLASGGGTYDTNGFNSVQSGAIGGTGRLTKAGAGTLTLGGTNNYSGGTVVNGGTLAISSDVNLGLPGGGLTLNGGTLQTTAAVVSARTVTLGSGGGTVNIGAGTVSQLSGAIDGSGGLTKTGAGSLILTGTNSYAGGTTISGGALGISADANLGNAAGGITLGSGSTLAFRAAFDLASTRAITLNGGSVIDSGAFDTTISQGIGGTGGLTKVGSGTLTLAGNNGYTGGTTVMAGTLVIGVGGSTAATLSGTASVTSSAAELDLVNATLGLTTVSNLGTIQLRNTTSLGSASVTNNGAFMFFNDSSSAGTATIDNTGSISFLDSSTAGSAAITVSLGASLSFADSSSAGSATVTTNAASLTQITGGGSGGTARFVLNGASSRLDISGSTSGTTAGSIEGAGQVQLGANNLAVGGNNLSTTMSGVISDGGTFGGTGGSLTKVGTGTLILSGINTYTGGTTVSGGTLQGTTGSLQGNIVNNAALAFDQVATGTYAGSISGSGSVTKSGTGAITFTGTNSHTGGTAVNAGILQIGTVGTTSALTGAVTVNGGTLSVVNANLAGATVTTNTGITQFTNSSTASGATLVTNSGAQTIFAGNATAGTARVVTNAGGIFFMSGLLSGGMTAGSIEGAGTFALGAKQLTVGGNNLSTTVTGNVQGMAGGSLVKVGTGTLSLNGATTYGGGTTVSAGRLAVNGTMNGPVVVGPSGDLGGSGTIGGLVTINSGMVSPGNSIGTLTLSGNYVQNGGTYQVEVNSAGQGDRINVAGTATINGGTVAVTAQSGSYARNTTYTILTATGGLTGTYANVTSNFAFLSPTLSYNANNVFLNLELTQSAFANGAQTANERAVGQVLDMAWPTATGDFATVINAIAALNTQQGPAALTAISGQNYAGMASAGVASGQLFLSNFAAQAGGSTRVSGGGARATGTSSRVEMAEACDTSCEAAIAGTWGVWGGGIGGVGSFGGNSNSGTTTYNLGGFAGGIDRQITENVLLGFTMGYSAGTQWTQGFSGRSTSSTLQAGLYGSFLQGPLYVDGLLAYAYSDNQMQRQIAIPGLQARTANGRTAANQFLAQIETGWRFDIGGAPEAYVIPFARLQGLTTTQNGFSESGADSLNLSVAAQTTNSLRSVLGVTLGGAMDLGWREKLAAQFKLGWAHEYAGTDRPVTASFAGAPALAFTTFGATPQRDGIVIGLNATAPVAERTSLYVRYEGEIQGVDNSHAGSIGIRLTW